MNPEALRKYSIASLQNARELIEEANTLVKASHFARTYFLSVAAIEETGKALLAFGSQGRNLESPSVASKLRSMLGDHPAKINAAFTGFIAAKPNENLQPALDLISALKRGRNPAMYTDMSSELEVISPSQVISEHAANECLRLANDIYGSAIRHMSLTNPGRRTDAEDAFFSMKGSTVQKIMEKEDFWRYYIARMEAGNSDIAEAVLNYRDSYFLKGVQYQCA